MPAEMNALLPHPSIDDQIEAIEILVHAPDVKWPVGMSRARCVRLWDALREAAETLRRVRAGMTTPNEDDYD